MLIKGGVFFTLLSKEPILQDLLSVHLTMGGRSG